jgi:stage II sporulation protein D
MRWTARCGRPVSERDGVTRRRALGLLATLAAGASAAACGVIPRRTREPAGPRIGGAAAGRVEGTGAIRVNLSPRGRTTTISATGGWRLSEGGESSTLVGGGAGDPWRVQLEDGLLRAVHADGRASARAEGPLILRALDRDAFVTLDGKRYRGELHFHPGESGPLVVNRVPLESYLRGVVPLEIGTGRSTDTAAVQAQAVAARSYALMRLATPSRPWDVMATVDDQVYGGVEAERDWADYGVSSTLGLVLAYDGRVVSAPYHSTCGGRTAETTEVWSGTGQPYLQSVSDAIPGGAGHYCEISPRFRWTERWTRSALDETVSRHIGRYASVPSRGLGTIRELEIEDHTPTGRVGTLAIVTSTGRYRLVRNEIRFVLRNAGGAILNSTYFSLEMDRGDDGALRALTARGGGYGHGIGMCQWGAIGRARAGQDFREILRTYYPGTTVAAAD